MAVCDFTMLFVRGLLFLSHEVITTINTVAYCKVARTLYGMFSHSSVIVLFFMTIEKCLAVKFPLESTRWVTKPRAWKIVAFSITLAFLLDGPYLMFGGTITHPKDNATLTCVMRELVKIPQTENVYFRQVLPWTYAIFYYIIPLPTLCVANIIIVQVVRRSSIKQASVTTQQVNKKRKMENEIRNMLILVTGAYCICITPIAVGFIIHALFPEYITQLVVTTVSTMSFINHAINVILYLIGGQIFRQEMMSLFRCGPYKVPSGRNYSSPPLSALHSSGN